MQKKNYRNFMNFKQNEHQNSKVISGIASQFSMSIKKGSNVSIFRVQFQLILHPTRSHLMHKFPLNII